MCLGGWRHSSQNSVVSFFWETLYIWVYLFVRYQIWVKDVQVCVWRCVQTGSFSAATESVSASSSSVTRSPTAQTEGFYKVFFSAFKSCRFISCSQRWKRLLCYGGPQPRWCKWFHQSLIWNNRFQVCDLAECLLPDCFCSADGTQAPGIEGGKLEVGRKS